MDKIEELKNHLEETQAERNKLKAKPTGPVVPWVGARVMYKMTGNCYSWTNGYKWGDFAEILDSPLHPQFMPNDGTNPWPDGMEVHILLRDGFAGVQTTSSELGWEIDDHKGDIIGSRPACGWEEYLKERE